MRQNFFAGGLHPMNTEKTNSALLLAPSNQLLQEHAEIAEENVARKISARFASSGKILEHGLVIIAGCIIPS